MEYVCAILQKCTELSHWLPVISDPAPSKCVFLTQYSTPDMRSITPVFRTVKVSTLIPCCCWSPVQYSLSSQHATPHVTWTPPPAAAHWTSGSPLIADSALLYQLQDSPRKNKTTAPNVSCNFPTHNFLSEYLYMSLSIFSCG